MSQLFTCRRPVWQRHALAGLITLAVMLGLGDGIVGFSGVAQAQKAGVLTGTTSWSDTAWMNFIRQKIVDTGLYPDGIDQIDCSYSDPTLAQLSSYRLLVVFANATGLNSSDNFGNVLGDYMSTVPSGAVLLFLPNTWQTGVSGAPAIGGKFLAQYALVSQSGTAQTSATARGNLVADDALSDSIPEFDCGTNCARVTDITPLPGAQVAATWKDGTILAVHGPRRVDLNMQAVDESVLSGSWKAKGNVLLTRALYFLSVPLMPTPLPADLPSTCIGGSTEPQPVRFRNISDETIQVTRAGLLGSDQDSFSIGMAQSPSLSNPIAVRPGQTLSVDVSFHPEEEGPQTAALYLELDGYQPISTPLAGTTKGNLSVSVSPIDFGGILGGTTGGPIAVRLKNIGKIPVTVNKPVLKDAVHFELHTVVSEPTVSLYPGATYLFDVKFVPGMDTGTLSSELTITSSDASSPLVIPILAMAGSPAVKIPYSVIIMPDTPTGALGLPQVIPVTNIGFSDLHVTELSTDNGDFTVLNPPPMGTPWVIAAQQTKNFQVVFSPQSQGARSGTLTLKSDEPPAMGSENSNKTISLFGTGTLPVFRVSANFVDFGTVGIGMDVPAKTVDLINTGDGDLLINDVSILPGDGAAAFRVKSPTLPFVLAAGATIPLTLNFAPKVAGLSSASLRIVPNLGSGDAVIVALSGTGNGAVGVISPGTVNFGDVKVRNQATQSVTLTNNGNQDLTLLKTVVVPSLGIFAAMAPPDGTKIAPGKSITVNLVCIPANGGVSTGRLDLQTDDPAVKGGTKFSVALNVNGVAPMLSVTPAKLEFEPVFVGQRSGMRLITVKNTGSLTVDNLSIEISASPETGSDDSDNFSVMPGWKSMLAPGETSQIGIFFEPHIGKAKMLATAVLKADGSQVAMTVPLQGSSMSALLGVQPERIHFDDTATGQMSQVKYLTLRNDSSDILALEVIPPANDEFQVDTTQSKLSLPAGESTRVALLFAPRTPGDKSESIEVRLKDTKISLVTVEMDGAGVVNKMMPTEPPPVDMAPGCHFTATPHTHPQDFAPLFALAALATLLFLRRRASRN